MFEKVVFETLIFIAGFVDAIAGGGGLITLPVFTLLVGPGAPAIGTNKIVATVAALTALIVYARKGHLKIKIALPFLLAICLGSFIGSSVAPLLPTHLFRWAILCICPILLYITLKKDTFLKHHETVSVPKTYKLILSGLVVGFYDGVFGPGGGTFMLFALVLWAQLPLLVALASSKLANLISAAAALTNFSLQRVVNWDLGLRMAVFVFVGAILGSTLATKKSEKIVRPILVTVVILLMIRLLAMD